MFKGNIFFCFSGNMSFIFVFTDGMFWNEIFCSSVVLFALPWIDVLTFPFPSSLFLVRGSFSRLCFLLLCRWSSKISKFKKSFTIPGLLSHFPRTRIFLFLLFCQTCAFARVSLFPLSCQPPFFLSLPVLLVSVRCLSFFSLSQPFSQFSVFACLTPSPFQPSARVFLPLFLLPVSDECVGLYPFVNLCLQICCHEALSLCLPFPCSTKCIHLSAFAY